MKKWSIVLLSLMLIAVLAACGNNKKSDSGADNSAGAPRTVELKVGASPTPHAEILESIKPALEAQGIRLQVVTFNDYVQPNQQLEDGKLDANFFQHQPYLDVQNKERGFHLVAVTPVHVEPFGGYSKKIKSLDELKDGAKVAIPNDPSNGGRALLLLEKKGLITLKDNTNITSTKQDITANPKNLDIIELDAAMMPRQLDEADLVFINSNYALEANLNPAKDALLIEDLQGNPYANILVSREDNKDADAIKKLAEALHSEDVKKFIKERYQGAVEPAF
ncbi:D-methionine transport system substrate-binding protein [Paenibacillus sp. JGP012]|uniref:MetQ/NlpA family ABC transporter substrate-binding protein n=1 Tax=Paenibacillus sp. JGP012 TaxID=2735914 RepID=UPI001609E313|nr:MetQ/NlpA family ABC transporter substrate-binding protein [Paenibacillus sp. JGP012]MBB6020825.1 D-methionine transport system substrate-binding protein [Paenibacillus sp. JGP012]